MDKDEHIRLLEAKVDELAREKDLALSAMEIAVDLSRLTQQGVEEPRSALLDRALDRLADLFPFKAMGLFLVDEASADFMLEAARPAAARAQLEVELATLIEERLVALALQRLKPVEVSSRTREFLLVAQAVATPSRTRGLFLGVVERPDAFRQTDYSLLPLLLFSVANALESLEVYRYVKTLNENLETAVSRLERSEQELLQHRASLQKEVETRTRELTRANTRLNEEAREREKAQVSLAQEHHRLQAVLDTTAAFILVLDHEDRVLACNNACEEFCGVEEDVLRGHGFTREFIPPVSREEVRASLLAVRESPEGRASFESPCRSAGGQLRYVTWRATRLAQDDAPPTASHVIVAGLDISEKRSAEQALRASETRFRAVFMEAGVGIVLLGEEGYIISANPALTAMLQYSEAELARMRVEDLVHPEDLAIRHEVTAILMTRTKTSVTRELRYRRKDGGNIWGQATFTLVGDETPYVIAMVTDITAQKTLEQALRDAEATYRTLFENAVEGIFLAERHGPFHKVNPALATMLGSRSAEDLKQEVGDAIALLIPEQERRTAFYTTLDEGDAVSGFESLARTPAGEEVWFAISARAVQSGPGSADTVEGLVENIMERKAKERRLHQLATMDALTNVPNRHLFMDRLEHMLAHAERSEETLYLLYIDLDGFKAINDTHGHHVGDRVLAEVAERLRKRVRKADVLARIGGDEFTILLDNPATREDVDVYLQDLIRIITAQQRHQGVACGVGASIGVSVYPRDGRTADELLRKADCAMYSAKRDGGGCARFYSDVSGDLSGTAPNDLS